MTVDLAEVQEMLDQLDEMIEDPAAQEYHWRMQDNYEMMLREEYGLEKEGGEYDF